MAYEFWLRSFGIKGLLFLQQSTAVNDGLLQSTGVAERFRQRVG